MIIISSKEYLNECQQDIFVFLFWCLCLPANLPSAQLSNSENVDAWGSMGLVLGQFGTEEVMTRTQNLYKSEDL